MIINLLLIYFNIFMALTCFGKPQSSFAFYFYMVCAMCLIVYRIVSQRIERRIHD
jgi:hypothetical protein